MILSASRRTDIPGFYMPWFVNRLKEGEVLVRNPVNHKLVSRVALNADEIECIAFWTKNPAPLLQYGATLQPYSYFVQFTLNAYGRDIEQNLPRKQQLLQTFVQLAGAIGPHRMVWRYSPILLSKKYTLQYHLHYFEQLAKRLQGHTTTCRISFLEIYPKIAGRMLAMGIRDVPEVEKAPLARRLAEIGGAYGISLGGCGNMDVAAAGFEAGGCIGEEMVQAALGLPVHLAKSGPGQGGCRCVPSVDIGSYNTCQNGCAYCYANQMGPNEAKRAALYDINAPMLCDAVRPGDEVKTRKIEKLVNNQLRFC